MIPFWKKTDKNSGPQSAQKRRQNAKPAVPRTAQQSIPMQRMFEDGTCRVKPNYYTRTIQYQDINYQLAQQEDKTAIFEEWCSFLNFFDSSINVNPFEVLISQTRIFILLTSFLKESVQIEKSRSKSTVVSLTAIKKDDPRCNVNRLCETSVSCFCKRHLIDSSCKHHSIIKPCFLHWFYFLYSFLGW